MLTTLMQLYKLRHNFNVDLSKDLCAVMHELAATKDQAISSTFFWPTLGILVPDPEC
jgi:hypothetical protein